MLITCGSEGSESHRVKYWSACVGFPKYSNVEAPPSGSKKAMLLFLTSSGVTVMLLSAELTCSLKVCTSCLDSDLCVVHISKPEA